MQDLCIYLQRVCRKVQIGRCVHLPTFSAYMCMHSTYLPKCGYVSSCITLESEDASSVQASFIIGMYSANVMMLKQRNKLSVTAHCQSYSIPTLYTLRMGQTEDGIPLVFERWSTNLLENSSGNC